ncbi:hypothetical protein MLD38_011970 [Melastoma candidum]|uniref:Uncharacterized protein n=1 Tax=Melastoma candidum TaxID=119954 RepID=A0ACB9R7T9_9MYRT|nr:hypothetical protein MLD38_011970 [Melastoma candidum]
MFKGAWMATTAACQSYGDHHHHRHPAHHEYISGALSWPPRSYSCTFCKREFRSAQALGGHMNVHRRDRARLRQLPLLPTSSAPASSDGQYPFLSLNPGNANPIVNPNPNPSLPPYSPSLLVPTRPQAPLSAISESFPQINLDNPLLSPRFRPTDGKKIIDGFLLGGRGSRGKDLRPWMRGSMKSKGVIKLGMEVEVGKEDLDLELRLGCP